MQGKGITGIGNDLQTLSALRKLDLSFNPLNSLNNIGQFPKLSSLSAYCCAITDVDDLDK